MDVSPGRSGPTSAWIEELELELEPVHSLEAARVPWCELATHTKNIFATWEWASVWWRHFAKGREPLVTLCRERDGMLAALLPLYVWKTWPLRVARFIGHGPADQLGPLCMPEQRTSTAIALRRTLADVGCKLFLGETLDGRERWSQHLGAQVYGSVSNPFLRLEWSSWEAFLDSRTRNFRSQLRRRERALDKRGLRFRLCDDPDRLDRDLDVFFRLHRSRWRDGTSNVARTEAFHREFAARAFERGWLRLWFLEVADGPVAAWYGLRWAGVDWYYQAGRDRAWDRFGVGFVLLAHSIREAIRDGMHEYRFGRGGEHYKTRFGPQDLGSETILLTQGRSARAAVVGVDAVRRTKRIFVRRGSQ
jgi:CelD/BcsL family acetyltransferase involved in cellulose biosynthesis